MKKAGETMETIKSAGHQAGETLSRMAETAHTELVDPARDAVKAAVDRGEAFARRQGENLSEWVVRQPLTAVGAAFGLGMLVALYIKLK